jgi:hypothetical protein
MIRVSIRRPRAALHSGGSGRPGRTGLPGRGKRRTRRSVAVAAVPLLLVFGSGCGDESAGPTGPEPLDLTTPSKAIGALEVLYQDQNAAAALALLGASYRFYPLDPADIPFLGSGETSWDRAREAQILEEILDPERITWLDVVLLEITVTSIGDEDGSGRVTVESRTQLHYANSAGTRFERSESMMVYVYQRQENGDYLLVEERETAFSSQSDILSVSVQKARALDEDF